MSQKRVDRRRFLKQSAAVTAGATLGLASFEERQLPAETEEAPVAAELEATLAAYLEDSEGAGSEQEEEEPEMEWVDLRENPPE